MICPLLAAGVLATPGVEGLAKLDLASENAEVRASDRASACLEDACAFWIPEAKMCAAKAMGMAALKLPAAAKIDEYEDTH